MSPKAVEYGWNLASFFFAQWNLSSSTSLQWRRLQLGHYALQALYSTFYIHLGEIQTRKGLHCYYILITKGGYHTFTLQGTVLNYYLFQRI